MNNDYILNKEEQENIQDISELNAIYDLMLGKPIPGEWLPWGPKRDPETAEDPEVARKLLKQMGDFHRARSVNVIDPEGRYEATLDKVVDHTNSLTQHNEELRKFQEDTVKKLFS